MLTRAILATVLCLSGSAARAESLDLALPLDCTLGRDCWVQQYFDHDPGPGTKDYACGTETYDRHDGIDIRVADTAHTAPVVASAAGVVKAVRDGIEDHLVKTEEEKAAVMDSGLGNVVIIAHPDGFETVYGHMRRGTVRVQAGEKVERGTRLGDVGYSGLAGFPHVHFAVRKAGKFLDPFQPASEGTCGAGNTLWSADAMKLLKYQKGNIIGSGFSPRGLELSEVEQGKADAGPPATDWPAVVFYGWAINLSKGDTVIARVEGPDGREAHSARTMDSTKAQYLLMVGLKRPAGGWPPGTYKASLIVNDDTGTRLAIEKEAVIQ